jgi:hypothetical protein
MARTPAQPVDLRERIVAAAGTNTDISRLTPELVLGLTRAEITRLRQLQLTGQYPPLPAGLVQQWQAAGRRVNDGGGRAVLVRAERGGQNQVRQRVACALQIIAAEQDLMIVCEELAPETTAPVTTNGLNDTWLHILLPAANTLTDTVRIGGQAISCLPNRPTRGQRLIRLEGEVIARREAGNRFTLFANPWLRATTLTSAHGDNRRALMSALIAPLVEAAINLWPGATAISDDDLQLREAILTLDLLPGFARAIRGDIEQRRHQLQLTVTQVEREVTNARHQFVEALRQQTQLSRDLNALDTVVAGLDAAGAAVLVRRREPIATEADRRNEQVNQFRQQLLTVLQQHTALATERAGLEANAETITPEHLATALTEVTRIRAIRTVRSVELVSRRGDTPSIKVTLHPLVMCHRRNNYLFDKLVFTLALDGAASVRWENIRQHNRSPHPHISHQGTSCWGQAHRPLAEALQRREFSTAVRFINGWARVYNSQSPYVAIENFPTTTLDEGWHPELPIGAI